MLLKSKYLINSTLVFSLILTPSFGAESAANDRNSIAKELASFKIDPAYEISLFADESMGIANPICMRWDSSGRLWVLCSSVYPQLKPGDTPNDQLIILEDTNKDGKADKASVFADGLNMPTGFALGQGGVYLGQGKNLLHLRDTNGDGKADQQTVLFTGFGTGDTHQNINSFTWTPGGELMFCQGLHCFSSVETPWGIRRLAEHGSWRLRPLRHELHSFVRSSGGGNPWGYAFGKWGEPFIKSNGPEVSELLPSMIPGEKIVGTYWGGEVAIGASKIKSMIIEIVDSQHLPDDLQGDFLIAGYYARNIARLKPSSDGSGHRLETMEPFLTSTHESFRPVDIQTGPDGSLFVADWFNPIIGHYQASFRHPNRDKNHGRIWRIKAKERDLLPNVGVDQMTTAELCVSLNHRNRWVRNQAKLRLMDQPSDEVAAAIQEWIKNINPKDPDLEYQIFQAIGVLESHEIVDLPLLQRLLSTENHLARAYATRVLGRWHDRIEDPLAYLRKMANDPHPRVRLEAIVALSYLPEVESIALAAEALHLGSDRFMDYAFSKAVYALADAWKPALLSGQLKFEDDQDFVKLLSIYQWPEVTALIRKKINNPAVSAESRFGLYSILAAVGNAEDLTNMVRSAPEDAKILKLVRETITARNIPLSQDESELLKPSLESADTETRSEALRLCAAWKLQAHAKLVQNLALNANEPNEVRVAATNALATLGDKDVIEVLTRLTKSQSTDHIQIAAIHALLLRDLNLGLEQAANFLSTSTEESAVQLLSNLAKKAGVLEQLATAIADQKISKANAEAMRAWLNISGRSELTLITALNKIIGVQQDNKQEYDKKYVDDLAKEVLASGDAAKGELVFQNPAISCIACHQVNGIESAVGNLGPDLSALAAGLPVEIIIESVIWPNREIKEGYASTTIITNDDQILSGTIMGQDEKQLVLKDPATGKNVTVPQQNIKNRTDGLSTMPKGLTSTLNRTDLRDLIKYLTTLKNK